MISIDRKRFDALKNRPEDKLKEIKPKKVEIFDELWLTTLDLPNPPQNSSLQAKKDLEEVIEYNNNATNEQKRQYLNCDEDASYYIKAYMDDHNLDYEKDVCEYIETQCIQPIRLLKNKFNRPRPVQLAELYEMEIPNIFETDTSVSPSYPSGHTVQPRVVALYYAKKYPQHRAGLLKGADICGFGRVLAGLHFPSDYDAGKKVADQLIKLLKKDNLEEDAPVNATGVATSTDASVGHLRPKKKKKKLYDVISRF